MALKQQGIVQRKNDHLDIILNSPQDVTGTSTGFEYWRFVHCALPEIDYQAIDLSSRFLGKTLNAPLLISSMTGGAQRSKFINHHLAEAAQELRVAMGVGSQRIALEGKSDSGIDKSLRRLAPDIPLMANLGAAQLAGDKGLDDARRVVEMIEADAHLRALAMAFADWGIPTADAVKAIAESYPQIPLIASGGIRTGIDVAKALRLGASLAGQAAAILDSATESSRAVVERFAVTIDQLKLACFCTGSPNLEALKHADIVWCGR